MSFLKNFWFQLKARRTPRLTDAKTQNLINKHNQADQRLVSFLSEKKIPSWKQLKYIGKILTAKEKIIIRILGALIIAAVIFIAGNSYLFLTKLVPDGGGEYSEGLIGAPQYVNPVLAQTNDVDLDLASLVFSGLLKYDPDNGLVPDLAKSYSLSEDQKTYTFELKDNIYWHDGIKFSAEDIIFTFERIKEPNTKSPLYFNFKGVVIEKIDERTIRFILNEPFAPFLESLITGILPAHIWNNVPAPNTNLSEYNLKPIGTGLYKFKSLTKDNKTGQIKKYVLERNSAYFNRPANIQTLSFKFYASFDEAIEALNNKNIQAVSFLPHEKKSRVLNSRGLNFHLLNLPQYTALFFNKNNNALLKDLTLRKILAHAIDKEKIVAEILNSQAQIIHGPFLPGQLGYSTDFAQYPYNIDHAKAELEKAGWQLADYAPAGAADQASADAVSAVEDYPFQVRKKGGNYLELTITTVDQPENALIAQKIQKDWQQIGVKTNINLVSVDSILRDTIKPRKYEILLYGEILGFDPDPYPFWHSSQSEHPGLNLSLFANKTADDLLDSARKTADIEARTKKYLEFQKLIAEQVPAIFLFNPTYIYPQTNKLQGFSSHTLIVPANRFANIADWYIETRRAWK